MTVSDPCNCVLLPFAACSLSALSVCLSPLFQRLHTSGGRWELPQDKYSLMYLYWPLVPLTTLNDVAESPKGVSKSPKQDCVLGMSGGGRRLRNVALGALHAGKLRVIARLRISVIS